MTNKEPVMEISYQYRQDNSNSLGYVFTEICFKSKEGFHSSDLRMSLGHINRDIKKEIWNLPVGAKLSLRLHRVLEFARNYEDPASAMCDEWGITKKSAFNYLSKLRKELKVLQCNG